MWYAVNVALLLTGAQALSDTCRVSFKNMNADKNYMLMNTTMMAYCRVRVENKLAGCCDLLEFQRGKAEGCATTCGVSCEHRPMEQLCNQHFGLACKVKRQPFFEHVPSFEVIETFCTPKDCLNPGDLSSILLHFDVNYKKSRSGWRRDYEHALLECPDGLAELIGIVLAVLVGFFGMIALAIFLFKPPPNKGQPVIDPATGRLQK